LELIKGQKEEKEERSKGKKKKREVNEKKKRKKRKEKGYLILHRDYNMSSPLHMQMLLFCVPFPWPS
jgi:hypothetical protein